MTPVKICGITNKEDALHATKCGAAALGFIFYPASPRYVAPEAAQKIISVLPGQLVTIGVFVNASVAEIKSVLEYCAFDMIQLHGDETPAFCREFPADRLIKAVELRNEEDLPLALSYDVAALLVDSRQTGLYGGTGKTSNWELARLIKNKKPLILSGGLNETNIADALLKVAPAALDINSGVESAPGKKDHIKLARLFDIIRQTDVKPDKTPLIFAKRKTL